MGAPAAIVEASGFIWAISGTSVAAAPTAPHVPVAWKRKSRRVGSAAAMVVTVSMLSAPYRAAGVADSRNAPAPICCWRRQARYDSARHHRLIGTLAGMAQAR